MEQSKPVHNGSSDMTQEYEEPDNQTQLYPADDPQDKEKPTPKPSIRASLTRGLSRNLMNSDDQPTQAYMDEEIPPPKLQGSDLLDLYNEAHEETSPDLLTNQKKPTLPQAKDEESGDETDDGESRDQNTQAVEHVDI